MKVVVNNGRTVHVATKAGSDKDGKSIRPVVKAHGPTNLIEVSDEDGKLLIARGFAYKYEAPKPVEAEPSKAATPPAPPAPPAK